MIIRYIFLLWDRFIIRIFKSHSSERNSIANLFLTPRGFLEVPRNHLTQRNLQKKYPNYDVYDSIQNMGRKKVHQTTVQAFQFWVTDKL